MSSFRLPADKVPKLLAKHAARYPAAFRAASLKAAHKARTYLVRKSPVDTGEHKNAWQVKDTGALKGVSVENNAPHAGIIEEGARPHQMSAEGIEALTRWVERKLLAKLRVSGPVQQGGRTRRQLNAAAKKANPARSIAFAIANKLAKYGQKGHWTVRDGMPKFSTDFAREMKIEVTRAINEGARGL